MNANDITISIRKKRNYLKKTFNIVQIGVFGSYVNGSNNKNSDIDILVDFRRGHKDLFNYMRLKFYMEKQFKKKIDLVSKEALKLRIKDKILSEVIYV